KAPSGMANAIAPRNSKNPASSNDAPPPIQRNTRATSLGSALMNALAAHSNKRRATTPSRNAGMTISVAQLTFQRRSFHIAQSLEPAGGVRCRRAQKLGEFV